MIRKIITIALLVIAVAAVVVMKHQKRQDAQTGCANGVCIHSVPQDSMMPGATAGKQAQSLPRLLDLGAGKCVPCKAMAPILEEMRETFADQLNVEFIDVWENEGAGEEYGIRMIPTQIFYDEDGKELFRHEGFYARADMLAKWKELGYEFK